jgi:hypothetical protein
LTNQTSRTRVPTHFASKHPTIEVLFIISYLLSTRLGKNHSRNHNHNNLPLIIIIIIMTDTASKPLIVADATKGIKVNATVVAKHFRDEIKAKVAAMKEQGLGTSLFESLMLNKLAFYRSLHSWRRRNEYVSDIIIIIIILILIIFFLFRASSIGRFVGQQGSGGQTIRRMDRPGLQKRRLAVRIEDHGRSH